MITWLCWTLATAHAAPTVSLGYYTPYGVTPGLRVRASMPLAEWSSGDHRQWRAFAGPSAAAFGQPGVHGSLLLGAEAGVWTRRTGRPLYATATLGLGYLGGRYTTGQSVDLATGASVATHDWHSDIVPTLGVQLGHARGLPWFVQASAGQRLAIQREDAAFFALELGITLGGREAQ